MKVSINKKVFEVFNDRFHVGLLWCSNLNNSGSPADIHEMLRDVEELVRINFNPSSLQTHELISAWKSAVAHYGEKAQHFQSSVERMMTYVLEGEDIETKNKLGDLCNFISLKYLVPLGVTDTDKAEGNIEFTLAGSEKWNGSPIEKNELIMKAGDDVISRKLDFNISSKGEVDKKTKNAIIHIEAIPPIDENRLMNILEELQGLVRIFCGAKIKKTILKNDKNEIDF